MNAEHLVTMANQISQFFESQPNHNEAVTGVMTHIRKFWDPRMRRVIIAHNEAGGEGMMALSREAVSKLAAETSAVATSPAKS